MSQWWTGRAKYAMRHEEEAWAQPLVLAVRCRLDGAEHPLWCLLDTGAEFSVFGGEIARGLLERTGSDGNPATINTRHGKIEGTLERVEVSLVAEDGEGWISTSTQRCCLHRIGQGLQSSVQGCCSSTSASSFIPTRKATSTGGRSPTPTPTTARTGSQRFLAG